MHCGPTWRATDSPHLGFDGLRGPRRSDRRLSDGEPMYRLYSALGSSSDPHPRE